MNLLLFFFLYDFVRNIDLQYYKLKVEKSCQKVLLVEMIRENNLLFFLQVFVLLGIGVVIGEMCQNRVMFKQFLKVNVMQYCQIDVCRLGGVNEVLVVIFLVVKFNGLLWIFNLYFFI